MKANKHEINEYIYVTSEEKIIKLGDWFRTTDTNKIYKSDWIKFSFNNGLKIILCNNPNLPIQQLTTEEVEYLKSVDSFEVEESNLLNTSRTYLGIEKYKILIPQETEQPKESIEEVAEKKYPLTNILHLQLNTSIRTGFIEGYNHAKQTLYTEDEVLEINNKLLIDIQTSLNLYYALHDDSLRGRTDVLKEWFNKLKKK